MITAKNIYKSFGTVEVLKGVSIEIPKGKLVSIEGASGAGKSTLLHILGTLEKADRGTVEIEGKDISLLSGKELAAFRNKHIAFIFQFHHLLAEFSALENVCIPAFIAGMDKLQAEAKAKKVLDRLGLSHRLNEKPSVLSGGEQQRVAVARALINDPQVIFADEPSGNLDSANAKELHELFAQLSQEFNQTFVLVTHNRELAALSDLQFHMTDGLMDDQTLNKD